jgi:hypothetical protein
MAEQGVGLAQGLNLTGVVAPPDLPKAQPRFEPAHVLDVEVIQALAEQGRRVFGADREPVAEEALDKRQWDPPPGSTSVSSGTLSSRPCC